MSRPAGAITALLLCSAAVLLWAWPQPDSDQTDEAVAIDAAPAATVSALEANRRPTSVPRAGGQEADAQAATGGGLLGPRAALAPDGGALPDRQALEALGAVVAAPEDVPPGSIPSVDVRLSQARGAIAAFSDTVERLEGELREAQQTGVTDTSSLERRLAAASRNLELARFAERATEAELEGHPL